MDTEGRVSNAGAVVEEAKAARYLDSLKTVLLLEIYLI